MSTSYTSGPITFALTEGRLVVCQSGRPEDDYPAEDARALCKANDPNGDWDTDDNGEPVPLADCVAILNQWVAEDPAESAVTGRLFAAWLANDADTFQALAGRRSWAGRGGAP